MNNSGLDLEWEYELVSPRPSAPRREPPAVVVTGTQGTLDEAFIPTAESLLGDAYEELG